VADGARRRLVPTQIQGRADDMTRAAKRVLAAGAAIVLSLVATTALLLVADLYAHARAERSAGLNRWGYRGPVVGGKRPGETRIVMLGGSTAFGYGVTWDRAIPAQLEQQLRSRRTAPTTVVNLAYNNEGAHSFVYTLEDFRYLRYDIVIMYEGYNDMVGEDVPNTSVFRHSSPVFRLTGYFPILPLVIREKALLLRHGGDLSAAYRSETTVFRPNLVQRAAASTLETFVAASERLGGDPVPVSPSRRTDRLPVDGCQYPWRHYCASVAKAIDFALARGASVIVGTQPYLSDAERHRSQQRSMVTMLNQRFGANPLVMYVDLGRAIDLSDRSLAPDAMHLTPEGNGRIAGRLVGPVLDAIATRESRRH
jgi:hypothetical protein